MHTKRKMQCIVAENAGVKLSVPKELLMNDLSYYLESDESIDDFCAAFNGPLTDRLICFLRTAKMHTAIRTKRLHNS